MTKIDISLPAADRAGASSGEPIPDVSTGAIEARLDQGLLGQWYIVAKSVQVRGDAPFATRALGRDLVLWRGPSGDVNCLEDFCPHRGAPLSRGRVMGDTIRCGYHGLELDGDGVVRRVPALPGCTLEGRRKLDGFAVQEQNDAIFAWFPSPALPEPQPLTLPYEFDSNRYATFLTTSPWECNYRYAMENLADPMHGCYLHADSFTLSEGSTQDTIKLDWVDGGFTVSRVAQQGENFDWTELILDHGAHYCRVNIPYPAAGGPGGMMRVVSFVTPVDATSCRIFFWRCRSVTGTAREAWRFLFRTTLESRHWDVLEQDREMLAAMRDDAREHESLYQHDMGITRLRQQLKRRARAQIAAEAAVSVG